jgi:hypothetical protein
MFARTMFPSKKKILARNFPHTPGCGTVSEPCCPWSVQKINDLSNLTVAALREIDELVPLNLNGRYVQVIIIIILSSHVGIRCG